MTTYFGRVKNTHNVAARVILPFCTNLKECTLPSGECSGIYEVSEEEYLKLLKIGAKKVKAEKGVLVAELEI